MILECRKNIIIWEKDAGKSGKWSKMPPLKNAKYRWKKTSSSYMSWKRKVLPAVKIASEKGPCLFRRVYLKNGWLRIGQKCSGTTWKIIRWITKKDGGTSQKAAIRMVLPAKIDSGVKKFRHLARQKVGLWRKTVQKGGIYSMAVFAKNVREKWSISQRFSHAEKRICHTILLASKK